MDYYRLEQNREEMLELLKERESLLKHLVRDLRKEQKKPPAGILKVAKKHNTFQYYRKEKDSEQYSYLPKSQRDIAEKIINFDYRASILSAAAAELKAISEWKKKGIPTDAGAIYDNLPEGRKVLVHSISVSNLKAIEEFQNISFSPLETFPENKVFETTNGEKVRSKAEWMIAEKLTKNGIPYQYEFPVTLRGYGVVRPDFRCFHVRKRKVILWEHQGRMDDGEYANAAIRKVNAYEENGFFAGENLILTSETATSPLTPAAVDRWIQKMFL